MKFIIKILRIRQFSILTTLSLPSLWRNWPGRRGCTLGTLIGADLTNLGRVMGLGVPVVSIGGAGTFDGILLVGILRSHWPARWIPVILPNHKLKNQRKHSRRDKTSPGKFTPID